MNRKIKFKDIPKAQLFIQFNDSENLGPIPFLFERTNKMGKQAVSDYSFSLCPKSYTWIVQKQINCFGKTEFMVEVKELEGCVSYGATYSEAIKGLEEAIQLWFKHHNKGLHFGRRVNTHVVQIEPMITKEQSEEINRRLLTLIE